MPDYKQYVLASRLLSATRKGHVEWRKVGDAVEADVAAFCMRLSRSIADADNDTYDYTLTVLKPEGDIVDVFTDVELEGVESDSEERAYRIMDETFAIASRHASGVNAALDTIIEALGDDDQRGFSFRR
jgi:predicted GTPase